MPLISFIVPYHNEPAEMLRECLGSIVRSTEGIEAEIIVVDDGSDHSPIEVVEGMSARIVLLRQPAEGLSAARNRGIQKATGRYLQFVDSDDELLPSAYASVLRIIAEKETSPECCAPDVFLFQFTRRKKDVCLDAPECRILWKGSGTDFLQHRNLRAAACSYVFRRELLSDLNFCPGIYHEDELFTPQLFLRAQRVCEVDAEAYYYRLREGSIITANQHGKVCKRLDDAFYVVTRLKALDDVRLERRIAQLTMDLLYNVVRQTRSPREFLRYRRRLVEAGLYPLPLRCYTTKYYLFALLSHLL